MKLNKAGIDLKKQFEGCRLTAYLCPANKWTIGWGNTFYADGKPVKQGDKITQAQADELLSVIGQQFDKELKPLITANLTDNQYSAICSFAYNVGVPRFRTSTLRRMINANPNNPLIRNEFMKWVNKGTPFERGLTRRRQAEADLYFKP